MNLANGEAKMELYGSHLFAKQVLDTTAYLSQTQLTTIISTLKPKHEKKTQYEVEIQALKYHYKPIPNQPMY